jgi:hypothetical protein
MKDIVFYADNTSKPEAVGRLRPDGSWTGEDKLFEDIVYVAEKNNLDITTLDGRQMLLKLYSGAYLWAVMETEDAPKK